MVQTQGNPEHFQQVYQVLRDLASMLLSSERKNHTLQPTALVNEAFVKLEKSENTGGDYPWNSKTHFQAVAARAMRQILVDHARHRSAQKRGGDWQRITMSGGILSDQNDLDFEALDEALELLAEKDQRKSRVVELRFFGGLTCLEIANELDVSPKTVESDWYFARAWLRKKLGEDPE
jgi:RNA polymerase sigma factor (TIGR02999 family)